MVVVSRFTPAERPGSCRRPAKAVRTRARLTGNTVESDRLHLSLVDKPAITPPPDNYTCTADFNPVTFMLRVERDLMKHASVVDFGDTEVSFGPAGEVTSEDYGG